MARRSSKWRKVTVEPPLPSPPTDAEKLSYINKNQWILLVFSLVSFSCLVFSQTAFMSLNLLLWIAFAPYIAFTVVYYVISLLVNFGTRSFDLVAHEELVRRWKEKRAKDHEYPSVDIMLPICKEPLEVLQNTWTYVRAMMNAYPGAITAYVLDDGYARETVRDHQTGEETIRETDYTRAVQNMADRFGLLYSARHEKWMKKAGNMFFGFHLSARRDGGGTYIMVFDANFCPRPDMPFEMLPYMEAHPRLGIVQTPQYFRIMPTASLKKRLWLAVTRRSHKVDLEAQNWLESGAGSVQELFYRAIQQSREQHNGAICVGTNAMYRRAALAQNGQGGPSLIGHSEDVHTGFDLRRLGWGLMYIPVVLAAGVCPTELQQFVQQQYRWCMGSMSLLGSRKFWQTKMTLRQRCCYLSGFCYYIHTAVSVFVAPFIPLALLWFFPGQVRVANYLLILPSVVYNFVVFRRWHHVRHDLKAWAVKLVYAWAHGFALTDILRGKRLGWNATGANTKVGSFRVRNVRWLIGVWGGATGLAWAASAAYHMVFWNLWDFAPNLLSALWYSAVVLQAVSSTKPKRLRRKQLPAAT